MATTLDQAEQLKQRTKKFAIRVVHLVRCLPKTEEARIIGRQLLRSGTSVAANYRASCRSRSSSEFAAKIGVVVEEADESAFWLEMLAETGIIAAHKLAELRQEAEELLAVFAASQRTARASASRTRTAVRRNAACSGSND